MSWNEPGGGKKPRDPWGGGDQGPPDLDEALKRFQEKLGGLFGGGKSGGSGSGGSGIPGALLGGILVVLLIAWFFMGLYKVDEQERAVVLRFGKFHEVAQPGLHWNPPLIDQREIVNTTKVRAVSFRETMLTKDENIVEVNLSVQYYIDDPKKFVLEVREPESSLQHATQSALRHVVGDSRMDLVLTEGRAEIAQQVRARVQDYIDSYNTGIRLSAVNVDDAQPPDQVQDAFDDVIKAREDEERLKNEAQAYANGVVPEARGFAQRTIEEANAYRERVIAEAEGEADRFSKLLAEYRKAPEVTRERLYIDALQNVYSRSSKVMVDVENGSNMMYLPLDKLMERRQQQTSGQLKLDRNTLRELTNAVANELRNASSGDSRSSSRGGR